MNRSVGPFEHRAAHERRDRHHRRRRGSQASAIPPTARIGPIEMTGFDGPITTVLADAIASSASGVGIAGPAPSTSTPSTGPAAPWRIMKSWKPNHSPRARMWVRTGSSVGGSTRAGTPSDSRSSSSVSVSRAPSASRRARRRQTARSWSPRLNQTSSPSSRSASITANVSPLIPQPRGSMRSDSQKRTRSGSGET